MKEKNEKLRYESVDRVARYNLCQKLVSAIYHSWLTNPKIKKILLNIYDIEKEINKK